MSLPPLERLLHIRDEIQFLQRCRHKLPDLTTLVADEVMCRAVVKSIEIIGEATKNLPVEWRGAYPEIPWRNIARMRDKLTHHYFDTDFEFVWLVMHTQITRWVKQWRECYRSCLAKRFANRLGALENA